MTNEKKVKLIQNILNKLFPNPQISLEHKDPYTLLIAVLLSARSTDKKVNEITPLLFKKASNPKEMAKLSESDIRKIIKPIGLSPQKAKSIKSLSKILVDSFDSKVPKTFEELESLPGVGHKTASVVMSQAFDIPAFPVDTHVQRCAKRWKLTDGKNVKKIEEDLKKLFPKKSWNKLHLQIIYFGRTYCRALGHKKENCPICSKI